MVVSGGIVGGKRTFIERSGLLFELPTMHTMTLYLQEDGGTIVALRTPQSGSTFELNELEELEDRVIVRLGELRGQHGPPGIVEVHFAGYPFPAA
jgi:hypothetical protein